jgi:hypothetical protein
MKNILKEITIPTLIILIINLLVLKDLWANDINEEIRKNIADYQSGKYLDKQKDPGFNIDRNNQNTYLSSEHKDLYSNGFTNGNELGKAKSDILFNTIKSSRQLRDDLNSKSKNNNVNSVKDLVKDFISGEIDEAKISEECTNASQNDNNKKIDKKECRFDRVESRKQIECTKRLKLNIEKIGDWIDPESLLNKLNLKIEISTFNKNTLNPINSQIEDLSKDGFTYKANGRNFRGPVHENILINNPDIYPNQRCGLFTDIISFNYEENFGLEEFSLVSEKYDDFFLMLVNDKLTGFGPGNLFNLLRDNNSVCEFYTIFNENRIIPILPKLHLGRNLIIINNGVWGGGQLELKFKFKQKERIKVTEYYSRDCPDLRSMEIDDPVLKSTLINTPICLEGKSTKEFGVEKIEKDCWSWKESYEVSKYDTYVEKSCLVDKCEVENFSCFNPNGLVDQNINQLTCLDGIVSFNCSGFEIGGMKLPCGNPIEKCTDEKSCRDKMGLEKPSEFEDKIVINKNNQKSSFSKFLEKFIKYFNLGKTMSLNAEDLMKNPQMELFGGKLQFCKKRFGIECCLETNRSQRVLAKCDGEVNHDFVKANSEGRTLLLNDDSRDLFNIRVGTNAYYCYFPNVLSKEIFKGAYAQLNYKPLDNRCRGLLVEELAKIDLNLIEIPETLSELQKNLSPDQITSGLSEGVEQGAESFKTNIQSLLEERKSK